MTLSPIQRAKLYDAIRAALAERDDHDTKDPDQREVVAEEVGRAVERFLHDHAQELP